MRKSIRLLVGPCVVFALALALGACTAFEERTADGYQIGDITSSVLETQATYCAESDPTKRAVALALLRTRIPDYPASGLCTDPLSVLPSIDTGAAGGVLDNVDIDQAIADQKAAQAKLGEASNESSNPE